MLRDEIAALIEPHIAEDDWGAGLHLKLAGQILALIDAGDLPLVEAATTFLQFWRQNPNGEVTERASLHLHAVLSLPLVCDSGSHSKSRDTK